MVRRRAACRVLAIALLGSSIALGARTASGADGAAAPAPSAAASVGATAPAAAPANDAIAITEDGARWEDAYGEKFYQVVGTVKNIGKTPVGAVRIRIELLDESGKVVATYVGWNSRAEALGDLDGDAARAELAELAPGPIVPGDSDRFRSTFLADETPKFASHRIRVLTVLPPA